jgi:hypothetical protein
MLLGGGRNRIGAAVALAAVLVMVLAAPAGASGWGWGEEKIWSGGFLQHVLTWLGLAPSQGVNTKSDQGSQIDPNGSPNPPKSLSTRGDMHRSERTGAASLTSGVTLDHGSQVDPHGRS